MTQWPHAPSHLLQQQAVYMITGATYLKTHFFKEANHLHFLLDNLLALAKLYHWELHAWALFSNHYHFIAKSPADPSNLSQFIAKFHHATAAMINQIEGHANRKVWYQFWDTAITRHTAYLARLNYVHQNPVKHGIVAVASHYPWCSAAAFEKDASRSFVKSVYSFDASKVNVFDDF